MRVREHDCTGTDTFQFSQPIQTAINHHICTAKRNQQRRMHAMSLRARAATKCEAWRQAFKHLWSIAECSEDCDRENNNARQLSRIDYMRPSISSSDSFTLSSAG